MDIFTDSLSALEALKSPKIHDSINPHLLDVMEKNLQFLRLNSYTRRLTLYWVPAHIGISGNELANSEAKKVVGEMPTTIRLPYTDHKAFFKRLAHMEDGWLLEEDGQVKGVIYFSRIRPLTPKLWYKGLKLSREMFVFISRCRSNHYSLNQSLHKINVVHSSNCECGQDPQDLNHILWQCPLHDHHRRMLMNRLATLRIHPPLDLVSFLCPPNIEVLQIIYHYLKDIDKII